MDLQKILSLPVKSLREFQRAPSECLILGDDGVTRFCVISVSTLTQSVITSTQTDITSTQTDITAPINNTAFSSPDIIKDCKSLTTTTKDKDSSVSISLGKSVRKPFLIPAVDDVRSYCLARKNAVDPNRFVDFYASKGWLVGKSPMKDWKAAVRTWERQPFPPTSAPPPFQQPKPTRSPDALMLDRLLAASKNDK